MASEANSFFLKRRADSKIYPNMNVKVHSLTPLKLKDLASSKLARWLYPIIVFLAAYAMQRSVALLGLDLHHDALMFDAAKRLLDGDVPFRDFFYQYNLGTIVFHMLALKVLGTYIASLKIATSVVYALIAVLIYMCAAVLGRAWQGLGMALIWSTLSPFHMPIMNGYHAWSTVYMMASVMAGALFLLMAAQKKAKFYSVLAGACFNLAFWFKQVAGLQILLVILWLLLNTRRSVVGEDTARNCRVMLLGFVLGGLISALPFFGYLYANDLFYEWWRSAFVFNKYFALSGASNSGLSAFLHTIFPKQRDLGYNSYIWLLLPLYLVAMLLGGRDKGGLLPSRADEWSRNLSLLLMLGLAGWIEYFPLSHAFHTQLFMAPVFCLIAIGQISTQERNTKFNWRQLMTPFLIVLALVVVIEALVHLRGLHTKITQTRVMLEDEMPTKGLRLLPEYVAPFEKFSRAVKTSLEKQEKLPAIPLSADPLRAVFPEFNNKPSMFNMGVDWSWPNEIVEPGFNQRRSELIHERKSPIYGDSIVAIPGYMPISLLEMPSPLGKFHSFYLPTADVVVKDSPVIPINRMYFLGSVLGGQLAFDQFNSLHLVCASPILQRKFLIPYGKLSGSLLFNIEQLHVSIISDTEFSKQLTELEYKQFMVPAMAVFGKKINADQFYFQTGDGKYRLKPSLTETDWVYLAQFFLSRGKLYMPGFASTLAQSEKDQPLVVTRSQGNECPNIAWSKDLLYTSSASKNEELYLAIPGDRFVDDGPITIYVQIVLRNKTTHNNYLRYGHVSRGMAREN